MFLIKASFIGDFKIGDNVNHNLHVLVFLYRQYEAGSAYEKKLLCKPIIIGIVSIIEAALFDFHKRIKFFSKEGVTNLKQELIDHFKYEDSDKFKRYIEIARKCNLFEVTSENIYDKLDGLRKLRNRVHIQNTKGQQPPNEYDAFREEDKVLSEKILERYFKIMVLKYERESHVVGFVKDFIMPWKEHFPVIPSSGGLVFCPNCSFPTYDMSGISHICVNCKTNY